MAWASRLWHGLTGRTPSPPDGAADVYESIASDFGRTRADYPPPFFDRLAVLGIGVPSQRVLDLGTGAGLLARAFARRGCAVTGVDASASMLAEARRLDQEAGVAANYVQATAEATGLEAASFDVVAASMAWPAFDRARATAECLRILRPGGALVLCHLHRLSLEGSVTEASNRLIQEFGLVAPSGMRHGLRPDLLGDLDAAGLSRVESFTVDATIEFTRDAWCGRVRSIPTVGPALSGAAEVRFSNALRKLLAGFPEPLRVPHRAFAAIGFSAGRTTS